MGFVAVVDDDAAMRKSLGRLLRARGYSVIALASAEEFLTSNAVATAGALVADIQLGGMSGVELARRLLVVRPTLPLIFITAHDIDAVRIDTEASGCVALLQKPFTEEEIVGALERCMAE